MKERRAGSFALGGGSVVVSWFFVYFFIKEKVNKPPRLWAGYQSQKSACCASTKLFFFWRPKETKAFFSSKAAGANQPHTKTKSTRAAFYWNVKPAWPAGQAMPLPKRSRPSFAFCLTAASEEKAWRLKSWCIGSFFPAITSSAKQSLDYSYTKEIALSDLLAMTRGLCR